MKSRRHFTCFIIVTFSMGQARTVACSQALAPNAPPVGAPFPLPLRPGSDIRPPSAPCPPSLHAALPLACTHCHTSLVPPQGLCTAPPPAWKAHPSEAPMAGFLTCSSSAQCHRLRDTILTILLPFVPLLFFSLGIRGSSSQFLQMSPLFFFLLQLIIFIPLFQFFPE